MSDIHKYNNWITCKSAAWESLCVQCGACCGALEDPCEHLMRDGKGMFFCTTYANRLGEHKTISGKSFCCVPIREKLRKGESWPGDERCGYKKPLGS